MKKFRKYLITSLILIGFFLRFYNLNWGAPFYFHPDEWHFIEPIQSLSITDLKSYTDGSYAYGNFPVILVNLIGPLVRPALSLFYASGSHIESILVLRLASATLSVVTLYLIFLIGLSWSRSVAFTALFLSVFSTGLIQQAHFGNPEGIIIFSAVSSFYLLLKFFNTKRTVFFYLTIAAVAVGVSVKVLLLILAPIPFLILVANSRERGNYTLIKRFISGGVLLLLLTFLLSPYYLTPEFLDGLIYQKDLTSGVANSFYVQSFFDTAPIVFQFTSILPFIINPILTVFFVPAFFYALYRSFKKQNVILLLLIYYFLLLFLPQSLLFTKWTRFIIPAVPFMYVIIAVAGIDLLTFSKRTGKLKYGYLALGITLVSCILFSVSYFITVFTKADNRITAAEFANSKIPGSAKILTEPFDSGINAFPKRFDYYTFNFYEYDKRSSISNSGQLDEFVQSIDYFISPSHRLTRSRMLNESRFPKGNEFYSDLINESGDFVLIYKTPCDVLCKIVYLGDPVFRWEETAVVYDRPTVFIYKKIKD